MSSFFVKKPRFAFVMSILIFIAGLISIRFIPTALLPDVNKPVIRISTSYPSGSPEVLETSFIRPVEEALNGIKHMHGIDSFATSDGFASVKVTFDSGTSLEQNEVNVQNRLSTITSSLPAAIQKRGLWIKPSSSDQLLVFGLYSPDNSLSPLQLSDYASRYLVKPLSRVEGVSEVNTTDSVSIHVALDIRKIHALDLSVPQVIEAIREQNQSVAGGYLGQMPFPDRQSFTFSILTHGLLHSVDQVQKIIIKTAPNGSQIYLKDIATISKTPENTFMGNAMLNGRSTSFINIYQRTDANSLQVAQAVKKEMARLSGHFPGTIKFRPIIDTSQFIQVSINEVIQTLIEAIVLVVLTIFIFLQSARAALIPVVAIPVSLTGTLAFMALTGVSVNTISLFALLLSIGIVVDDAIIVVENVERNIKQYCLSPKSATIKAMKEITWPILVTTCVLLSVFLAVTFLPGIQGKIFRQFAVVLSISVIISAFTALTLSPALCSTLLTRQLKTPRFMVPFAKGIDGFRNTYIRGITRLLQKNRWVMMALLMILLASFALFKIIPTGFIPEEDQGYTNLYIQLPQATSPGRVDALSRKVSAMVENIPGVDSVAIIPDNSADDHGIYGFVSLKPWTERARSNLGAKTIMARMQSALGEIRDSKVYVFSPPLIHGGGKDKLSMEIQDSGGGSLESLAKVANEFADEAQQLPEIDRIFSNFDTDSPSFKLIIDRDKAKAMGVSLQSLSEALGLLGPSLVSKLQVDGQEYSINLQVADRFRKSPENLDAFHVKNNKGFMVPITAFAKLEFSETASWIPHYNLYRSAKLKGTPATGYSSSEAIIALEKLAQHLPQGYTYTWSGGTMDQIQAKNTLPWLFLLAIVFIYLFLVALYESWSVPFSVLLIIPVATSGAFSILLFGKFVNNMYVQIGLLLLIGMVAKSIILMTDFAIKAREAGKGIHEAAHEAAKLRFRPVIMTSFSFILGVVPLLFANGPGANSRFYLGITISSGMLAATLIGTLTAPSAYAVIQSLREKIKKNKVRGSHLP